MARPRTRHRSRGIKRYTADRRTLFFLLLLGGCYAGTWFTGSYWFWLPSTLLAITACAAKHNHTHCPTFRARAANRALDLVLTLLTGTSTTSIRVPHRIRHHGKNQSAADFVRCSLVTDMTAFRALICYVPLVITETWRRGSADLKTANRHLLRIDCQVERLALWAMILGAMAWDWRSGLITFPVPWLVSQWFLIAINLPQHDGCDPQSRWLHSRNVIGNAPNWLFLNNGYHTAHHEAPGMHWSLLPDFHRHHIEPHLPSGHASSSLRQFWLCWWRSRSP